MTDSLEGTVVHIERPTNWNGSCLLSLPGWNLSAKDWAIKTPLCEETERRGWALVMPELSKSVYARSIYPETRTDWRNERLLPWVSDSLLNWLQAKYSLFRPNKVHGVLGLSTGGRGAILVAAARPDLFRVCGALSGDFIPEQMPTDNLMRGWYGPLNQFPERWHGSEHPVGVINRLKCTLFVAHGGADKVVPIDQSRAFVEQLAKLRPDLQVATWFPDTAGHDYDFWAACVPQFVKFINALPK